MRDYAPARELVILQNIEAYSSVLIGQGVDKQKRFEILLMEARRQRDALNPGMSSVDKLQRILDAGEPDNKIEERNDPENDQHTSGKRSGK